MLSQDFSRLRRVTFWFFGLSLSGFSLLFEYLRDNNDQVSETILNGLMTEIFPRSTPRAVYLPVITIVLLDFEFGTE